MAQFGSELLVASNKARIAALAKDPRPERTSYPAFQISCLN